MAYASMYQPYQVAPDPLFGGNGRYGVPPGGMGLPGMSFGGPPSPYGAPNMMQPGGAQQPGQGGWRGALDSVSKFTGFDDMSGLERAYMLASVGGGVSDYFERKGQREEEQRRYEQALEDSRRHRASMGANWNQAMGGM